jgi:mannose/fructose/N-acetylgalactosamine-specific phosphotransferase system component IID/mannose/fructose/N-acetylgalactosamine-specific phosphotransferase system component IIC
MQRKYAAAGAGLVVMMLLAATMPGAVLGAGSTPDVASHQITVSFLQAALIAIGYYLANSPWLFGVAYFTLYRPLVAGFIVGCILGDPAQGTLVGAAINVPYLGFISAGGSLPVDPSLPGWVGTTIALAGGLSPASAIALAVPLGLLGTVLFYGRMAVDPIFAHWADARATKGDLRGVAFMNVVPPQIFLFVISFVPVFVLALNGPSAVQDALNQLPFWITNGLIIAGGILPAIGIALTMRFIFRGSAIPYFFIGFILWMTMNNPATSADDSRVLIIIAVLGVALAWLHLSFVRPGAPAAEAPAAPEPAASAPGEGLAIRVTRGDIIRSWALWTFFSQANYNYERLQGTGFAHAMTPIIRRLYKTPEDIAAALQRHLVFFNTEPNFGNVVHGAVIAMEEQRANGAAIDDDAINSVKSGLMGPMAGIGDSISQGALTPILLALGIGIAGTSANISIGSGSAGIPTVAAAATGNPLGAIVYAVLISAAIIGIGYVAWTQGYVRGRSVVTDLLKSGMIDRVMIGAGVLGNLVLGAIAAKFVVAYLAPTVSVAGASLNLQAGLLDPLFPSLLPLVIVLTTWWLIRRVSPLWLVLAYLVFSIVAAYPFFGPGQTTSQSPEAQYQACTSSILHPFYPCGAPPAPSAQP